MKTSPRLRLAAAACALTIGTTAFAPVADAQDSSTPTATETATREEAPNTDRCPNKLNPPEPKTTSEAPSNGTTPAPIPAFYDGPCGVSAPAGFQVPENVLASAWLVADIDTGDIIAMKDPHGRYRPASIIKVLLALTVIRELPLDQVITVSHESASQDGSAVGIGEGGQYSVEMLLHGLLLASGNDAAHALAQALGGDAATLRKINALAAELGANETRTATYSGLDAPGMQTTAWDMAALYREAYNDPTFARISNTESIDFPGYGDVPGYELWNDNHLFMYDPDGIGGKTGYTDDANHTFVGALNRDGHRIMAIILDTTIAKGRAWQQAQSLIHEAYRFDNASAVADLDAPATQSPSPSPSPTPTPTPSLLDDSQDENNETQADSQLRESSYLGLAVGIAALIVLAAVVGVVVVTRNNRQKTTSTGQAPKHRRQ